MGLFKPSTVPPPPADNAAAVSAEQPSAPAPPSVTSRPLLPPSRSIVILLDSLLAKFDDLAAAVLYSLTDTVKDIYLVACVDSDEDEVAIRAQFAPAPLACPQRLLVVSTRAGVNAAVRGLGADSFVAATDAFVDEVADLGRFVPHIFLVGPHILLPNAKRPPHFLPDFAALATIGSLPAIEHAAAESLPSQ
jgi:hypothetical protein